jgi:hypothetical protein
LIDFQVGAQDEGASFALIFFLQGLIVRSIARGIAWRPVAIMRLKNRTLSPVARDFVDCARTRRKGNARRLTSSRMPVPGTQEKVLVRPAKCRESEAFRTLI